MNKLCLIRHDLHNFLILLSNLKSNLYDLLNIEEDKLYVLA